MPSKSRLELDVVLDTAKTPSIIELAKKRSQADRFMETTTVGAVADRCVEAAAEEILRVKGGNGKPN